MKKTISAKLSKNFKRVRFYNNGVNLLFLNIAVLTFIFLCGCSTGLKKVVIQGPISFNTEMDKRIAESKARIEFLKNSKDINRYLDMGIEFYKILATLDWKYYSKIDLLNSSEFKECTVNLKKYLEIIPASTKTKTYLLSAYALVKDTTNVQRYFDLISEQDNSIKSIKLNLPDILMAVEIYALYNKDDAIKYLKKITQIFTSKSILEYSWELMEIADALYSLGEIPDSVSIYEQVYKSGDKKEKHLFRYIDRLTMRFGKAEEALRILLEEAQCYKTHSQLFYYLGRIYFQKGEIDKAKDNFESAIKMRTKEGEAYAYLAYIYITQGTINRAISMYDKAHKFPHYNMYNIGHMLGNIYEETGEYELAISNIKNSITEAELMGDLASRDLYKAHLVRVYRRSNQPDLAKNIIDELLLSENTPNNVRQLVSGLNNEEE